MGVLQSTVYPPVHYVTHVTHVTLVSRFPLVNGLVVEKP